MFIIFLFYWKENFEFPCVPYFCQLIAVFETKYFHVAITFLDQSMGKHGVLILTVDKNSMARAFEDQSWLVD